MRENKMKLDPREEQIAELLLQGCSNIDIASELHMNPRTVKAHFNRLFQRFGIRGGVKRVKLATMLYRRSVGLPLDRAALRPAAGGKHQAVHELPRIGTTSSGVPDPSNIPRA